jgi:hypothetical protein
VIWKALTICWEDTGACLGIPYSNNADVIHFNLMTRIFQLIVLSDGYLIRIPAHLAQEAIDIF